MANESVKFMLDGKEVEALEGETIWQVAKRQGIDIPHLCYSPEPGYRADGNCRACMVEIEGERVLGGKLHPQADRRHESESDLRPRQDRAADGVRAAGYAISRSARPRTTRNPKFWSWADRMGIDVGRFPEREKMPAPDRSHPAMAVNLDACIQCNLCVRACREVQVNDVIGMAGRGHSEKIVFDFDDPMGQSTCVACGECVQACPTGALMPATLVNDKNVRTEIPRSRSAQRVPLLRRRLPAHLSHQERQAFVRDRPQRPGQPEPVVREGPLRLRLHQQSAAPDQADGAQGWRGESRRRSGRSVEPVHAFPRSDLGRGDGARRFRPEKIRDRDGPRALAGFGSAKGSNEEAYLFQKLVRTGFGSNNVDHCTRLCHASSVAALLEGVGSAAVTATFNECKNSDFIIVIGANPTENHPVAATFFKQAAKRGAKLVVMDPRGQALKRHAWKMMQFKNGTDVAMLNAMLNVIIGEKLYDQQYVQTYVEGFDQIAENVKDFTPEEMEPICGIPADTLREVARGFARAESAIIFWGMGVSQHTHGTDNARCLIALSLICGQVGRPGTGLHPLRGQNNVQGASDAGLIPMFFPDYKSVENPEIDRQIRKGLGHKARSQARQDRGRDHGRGACRRDQGHVHHGRKPRDVGPRPEPRSRRARASRTSRGAGHLPDRDLLLCRRRSFPPRPGRRRTAPSPTPIARCRWAARRCRCRATRARTCGSSRIWPSAWARTGTTSTSARCSPRWRT